MDQAVTPTLGHAPDRAVRGRLTAILIDGLIVGTAARLLLPAIGLHTFAEAAVGFLVLQFLYFFALEASGGTIGKRRAQLCVVQLDGTPPTPTQLAIRNALRCFDALPMFYASGLVSVMWTGPAHRQRLGDRVAGTTVIVAPDGAPRPTPSWLLPSLTVVALLMSVVIYGVLFDKYRTPNVNENGLTALPVPGFAGDNSQAPLPGSYQAKASVNGALVVDPVSREPMTRPWRFEKSCSTPTSCTYKMTRESDIGEETGELTQTPDGWHVTFPTHALRTTCPDGSLTTVLLRASFVLHFDAGGQHPMAHERNLFRSEQCGTFTRALDWDAAPTTF